MNSYVCVLSTNDYLKGVLVLNHNLKKLFSKYDLLCIINETITEETRKILDYFGIKYKEIKSIEYTNSTGYSWWGHTFDKLNIFSLTEYDKLVYLDSDFLILENLDELFKINGYTMASDIPFNEERFNSAVMVIKPNLEIYNTLLKIVDYYKEQKNDHAGDQDIINDYFVDKKIITLGPEYNTMMILDGEKEEVYDEEKNEYIEVINTRPITQNIEHPVILHYINKPKPFEIDARYKDKYSHIYKEYYDYVCKKLEEYKRDMD